MILLIFTAMIAKLSTFTSSYLRKNFLNVLVLTNNYLYGEQWHTK